MLIVKLIKGRPYTMQRFGEKLRSLRTQHGLSLKELAQRLGYSTHSYLSELEAGQKLPTVKFVLSVSRLFGVSTDQLLKDELNLDTFGTAPNREDEP